MPRSKARANRVVTFVTDGELEELKRGSEAAETSLSSYVHSMLQRTLEQKGK